MNLNRLLQINDDLSELQDQDFPDAEQRLYRKFLDQIKNDKITIPLLFSDAFKYIRFLKTNPHLIDDVKKAVQAEFDKNPNPNKGKFEQIMINGEEFLEKVPFQLFIPQASRLQVISSLGQKKMSLRSIVYDYFVLYKDDEVELTVKFHDKTYIKVQGRVDKLYVNTEDFIKIPISGKVLEMLTVEIRLISGGDNRRRHEESSHIFNTQAEVDRLLSKENQVDLFMSGIKKNKMTAEKIVERAKLFNIDLNPESWDAINNLIPIDFGAKKVTDLRDIMKSFYHIATNEEMLKFRLRLDVELKKMESWLNRKNADGKNGYFKV
jgi:hypothetical protein